MFGFSVVGLGATARAVRLPAVRAIDRTRLRWVVGTDAPAADRLRSREGADGVATHHRAVRDSTDIALVAPGRGEVIEDFLRQEVPVFAEGPVASSGERARALVAVADEADTPFGVSRPLREAPVTQLLDRLCEQGIVGPLDRVSMRYGRPAGPDAGPVGPPVDDDRSRGAMTHRGVHAIDLLSWLVDEDPSLETYRDDSLGGQEAIAEVSWTHPESDIDGYVETSSDRTLSDQVRIAGEAGQLDAELRGGRLHMRRPGGDDSTQCVEPCGDGGAYPRWWAHQFADFVTVIDTDRGSYVHGRQAVPVIELLEACSANRRPLEHVWEALPPTDDRREVSRAR